LQSALRRTSELLQSARALVLVLATLLCDRHGGANGGL